METVSLVREIGKIEKQMSELEKAKEYLAIEVTRLGSPQQVCLSAERNLGFKSTEITQQIALFDPVQNSSSEKWQRLLADLKHYGKRAWGLAEPEAIAQEKND